MALVWSYPSLKWNIYNWPPDGIIIGWMLVANVPQAFVYWKRRCRTFLVETTEKWRLRSYFFYCCFKDWIFLTLNNCCKCLEMAKNEVKGWCVGLHVFMKWGQFLRLHGCTLGPKGSITDGHDMDSMLFNQSSIPFLWT